MPQQPDSETPNVTTTPPPAVSRPVARPPGARPMGPMSGMGPTGIADKVPPAVVPLTYLAAAGVGLIAFGIAVALRADHIIAGPLSIDVVSVVHLAMLGFLSTAMAGALHQFVPVITSSPLRSNRVAKITPAIWLTGAWLLPLGFALNADELIVLTGFLATTGAYMTAWNLSGPLSKKAESDSAVGLRGSVTYFVITVSFGIVYASDLHHGWFSLPPTRVLAHAMLGLIGWVGLSYVSVAERLWPMFLLSHKKVRGAGAYAVRILPAGVAILATGLLFAWKTVAIVGGFVTAAGLVAHLVSLVGFIRLRRRRIETLQWFVIISATFLVIAIGLGVAAGLAPVTPVTRSHLTSAFVAALLSWLGLAVIGHSHKIVPFIVWTALRAKGKARKADGKAIVFGDLTNARAGWATLVAATIGAASLVVGLAGAIEIAVSMGGAVLAIAGAIALTNLSLTPYLVARKIEPDPRRSTAPRIPLKVELQAPEEE